MKQTPLKYHCEGLFCLIWNHWLNPLGNWIEPLPYPEKRKLQADTQWLPNGLWWFLRNPAANLMSHWLGIMPIGPRYQTLDPRDNGWLYTKRNDKTHWSLWIKRNRLPLPYYRRDGKWTFYIGWRSSGAFGAALRRNS